MSNAFPLFTRSADATREPGVAEVGRDTRHVLRDELELDEPAIAALAKRGVIGLG